MTTITIDMERGWIAKLLDRFITTLCTYIVEEIPKENTTKPNVYKLCEIYLGLKDEKTVPLVQVSYFSLSGLSDNHIFC